MAAPTSQRLFSLELLVDWVRLEAGPLPPPPPPPPGAEEEEEKEEEKVEKAETKAAKAEKEEEEKEKEEEREEKEEEREEREEAPSRAALCPAVAFRLLDFPTLLVYPPGGPAAAAPEPRPGLLSFGRGKSCLFRLHPATLCCRLLATPLYTLLLRLPPGRPAPSPQLLGTCSISLAAAAIKVLGPAATCRSHGQRGSFALHNHVGERVGDISLTYRLTDLGSNLLGHLQRPVTAQGIGWQDRDAWRAGEGGCQGQQEKQLPKPNSSDPEGPPGGCSSKQEAQRDLKGVVGAVAPDQAEKGPDASGEGRAGPPGRLEVTDLDMESNTFCPPPLYYTHVTPEKRPRLRGKVTIRPLSEVAEELDDVFPEEKKHVSRPAPAAAAAATTTHLLTRPSSAAQGTPVVLNPPAVAHAQDVEASHPGPGHPAQPELSRMNTVRQLPLLNALLVELSLLYNQPVTSRAHIHPHLAWLYRPEGKKPPECPARPTAKAESRDERFPAGATEKPSGLRDKRNQDAKLKKGPCFEKSHGATWTAPRSTLLYGLTNTLKLRLKQTNPGMLAVHERREQHRKMQVQLFGANPRIPAAKAKGLSSAKHQRPHRLPKDKDRQPEAISRENGASSKLTMTTTRGAPDDPAKETQPRRAPEKTADGAEARTGHGSLAAANPIVIPTNPIVIPDGWATASVLDGHVDVGEARRALVFQQVAAADRILRERGTEDKATENDVPPPNGRRPGRHSCSESISELNYSDDFTSSCFSEAFRTRSAGNPKHSQGSSKSSGTRSSSRRKSRERGFVPTPPFSAGSPVHSSKRSHVPKARGESVEEASTLSTSDLSSCWTEEKENQLDQSSGHPSRATKAGQDGAATTARPDCRSLENSQSIRTSQVSSYLPSNLSECSKADRLGEDSDEIASLNISEQCKDVCELLVNKLPGYTV